MNKQLLKLLLALFCLFGTTDIGATALETQAGHGRLRVSDNQRFLQYEDGTPFFWLGEYDSKTLTFRPHRSGSGIEDGVLIAIDATKDYLSGLY